MLAVKWKSVNYFWFSLLTSSQKKKKKSDIFAGLASEKEYLGNVMENLLQILSFSLKALILKGKQSFQTILPKYEHVHVLPRPSPENEMLNMTEECKTR